MAGNNPVYIAAVKLLALRDYTQHELILKLKAKSYPLSEITPIIQDLANVGLLNDSRFAENYLHHRAKRGYGPQRIAMELRKRGIEEEIIAKTLNSSDPVWLVEIQHIWQKHFKGKPPVDLKNRAKQIRFLQYRGFTQDQIDSLEQLKYP